MRFGSLAAAVMILGSARDAAAQATVTFEVPLNLNQIPAGIAKVGVVCMISSEAIVIPQSAAGGGWSNLTQSSMANLNGEMLYPMAARQEFWATGSLVVTARVVVSLPAEWLSNPVGKTARYTCGVQGWSPATLKWDFFHEQAVAPWKLKLTPETHQGEFVW